MANTNEKLKQFAIELFKIDAIKFGEYKTKIGILTPVYCDLRLIVSYPKLLQTLSELIIEKVNELKGIDVICGVPYTALPIATVVSIQSNLPMVMRRKEAKDYGTKKLIEGVFRPGDNCLIVEDVVTSGSSILETVTDLVAAGIKCHDAIVLLNRQQGGEEHLKSNGIKMHALLDLTTLMDLLHEAKCVDSDTVGKVETYLRNNQVKSAIQPKTNRLKLSYLDRSKLAKNPLSAKIFEIMSAKKTNLCIAADLTDQTKILNLAEAVGPHIVLFKTHVDVLDDFHMNFIKNLQKIAQSHNFLLFEDRKFADIGKTVQLQFSKNIYRISSWAPLITAHSLTGSGVLDAITASEGLKERGVFLLAETSASGSLIDRTYTERTVRMAEENAEIVCGVVCQSALFLENCGLVQLTPGVQIDSIGDNLGQRYNTPENVVLERGADVAVVGRGITQAADPGSAAEMYKLLLWKAYEKRLLDVV